MRAEDTLQVMADFYGNTIFPTRNHTLNHLFCTLGNGYEWRNGELVETVPADRVKRYRLVEHVDRAFFDGEENWNEQRQFYTKLYEDNPDRIAMKYRFSWYPPCLEYTPLFVYPNDIKPDWLALRNETLALVKQDPKWTEDYHKTIGWFWATSDSEFVNGFPNPPRVVRRERDGAVWYHVVDEARTFDEKSYHVWKFNYALDRAVAED